MAAQPALRILRPHSTACQAWQHSQRLCSTSDHVRVAVYRSSARHVPQGTACSSCRRGGGRTAAVAVACALQLVREPGPMQASCSRVQKTTLARSPPASSHVSDTACSCHPGRCASLDGVTVAIPHSRQPPPPAGAWYWMHRDGSLAAQSDPTHAATRRRFGKELAAALSWHPARTVPSHPPELNVSAVCNVPDNAHSPPR